MAAYAGCQFIAPAVVTSTAHANAVVAAVVVEFACFGFDAVEEFRLAGLGARATTGVGADGAGATCRVDLGDLFCESRRFGL